MKKKYTDRFAAEFLKLAALALALSLSLASSLALSLTLTVTLSLALSLSITLAVAVSVLRAAFVYTANFLGNFAVKNDRSSVLTAVGGRLLLCAGGVAIFLFFFCFTAHAALL